MVRNIFESANSLVDNTRGETITHVFLTAAGAIAVLVVAISFADTYLGLVVTLVSDVFGALRRLIRR